MKETMKMVTDQFGVGKDLVFEQEPVAPEPESNGVSEPEQPEIAQASAPEIEQQQEAPVEEQKPAKAWTANNFKTLKAEANRIAQERDELRQRLEQVERNQRYEQPKQQQPAHVEQDDFNIDPDAYAEGKHVKSLAKQMKTMQQENERLRRETHSLAIKSALISKYPDFDQVFTPENLKALELTKPHLARAINVNDEFAAKEACYDLIKQFGLHNNDEEEATNITKALISQNLAKPKTAAAVKGARPTNESTMGRASEFFQGELTDQMKKQFHKELQDAMKGYGGYKP